MKTNLKHISRRSISMLLCVLMLFSTLMVGTISTANAASITSDGSALLYFNMGAVSWWSATGNFAYFFNSSSNAWSENAVNVSGNYYYVKIPQGTWSTVILTRNSVTSNPTWDNKWNQTGNIELSTSNNYISSFAENSTSATWSTYQPTTTATLSASATSVNTGQNVTLTPGISDTTFNDYKEVSYSIEPSSGASISGNTFTATTAGTYTVTATVTYNAKGFTDITSTATATQTITVNSNSYTGLSVDKTGEGTVTISANSCTKGSSVNITATPATGYKFTKWTATNGTLGSTTTANTTFTPSANNAKATATFTENLYTVTVKADGSTATTVKAGVTTKPEITATDKDGYKFAGWATTGGASVADASAKTTTVSATATGTVTATYTEINYVRLYYSNPNNWSAVYAYLWYKDSNGNTTKNKDWPGEEITTKKETINGVDYYYVEFDSSIGYNYVIFNNNSSKTGDLGFTESDYGKYTQVSSSSDTNANWTALPTERPISNIIDGTTDTHGSIEFYSDSSYTTKITQAREGDTVYVKVTADAGYLLSTLTAGTTDITTAQSFTMPGSAVTVTATFEKERYYLIGNLTIKDKNGNSVSTGSNGSYSDSSTNIQFELVDEENQLYKVVTQNTVAELSGNDKYFRIRKGTSAAANNTQYQPSCNGNYLLKSDATGITLVEGADYNFIFSDTNDTSGPVILWFDAKTLNFYYTIVTYNISYVGDVHGDFTDKVTTAAKGTEVEVKPNPDNGYMLDTLKYNDGTDHIITADSEGKYKFTMPDSDVTVTATFKEDLSTNWELGGGYSGNDFTYQAFKKNTGESAGTVSYVTISLEANKTYEFKLRENGSTYYGCNATITGSVEDYTFYKNENNCPLKTTVAGNYTFKLDSTTPKVSVTYPIYTATIKADTGGSVDQTTINSATSVTATPDTGYVFDKWEVNDPSLVQVEDVNSATTTITPLANGGIVTAKFAKVYKVTVTGADYSSTPVDLNQVKVGTEVTITLTENTGYHYSVNVTGVSASNYTFTNNILKFTMPGNDVTVDVTTKFDVIVATPISGGTASVNKQTAAAGETITVTTTPNYGCELDTITVNDESTVVTNKQFVMPARPVTVTVTYKAIKPAVSNCPTGTITMYAGASYTIPATTDYGTLSYSTDSTDLTIDSNGVITAPQKEGTYQVTVKATNSPTGVTAVESDPVTFTVSVKFTDTQKAYNQLVADIAQYGHESDFASYYDTEKDEWTAYTDCVTTANNLVNNGFPGPDDTNTSAYTTASNNLKTAYNNLANIRKSNTVYILSKYNESDSTNTGYVNIYMFNKTSDESYTAVSEYTKLTAESSYAMKLVGTVDCNGSTKYLYKFEYFGKGDFIVYVGDNANDGVGESNKLTADVSGCKDFESYYIDLKDQDKTSYALGAEDTNTVLNYTQLSVSLKQGTNYCNEGSTYNLKQKVTITEGGTLKTASEVTVNHTYTYTFNGNTVAIDNPETWVPAEPGVYTITVNSTNGVAEEDVTNTFNVYVKDKLDTPLLVCTYGGTISSESNVYVTIEDDITISISNSSSYPEGTTFRFEVDGAVLADQTDPTLHYNAGELSFGKHTFRVTAIAPDTKFEGTNIKMYANSNISKYMYVTVENLKYTVSYNFTDKHVESFIATYTSDGTSASVTTPMSGSFRVDVGTEVSFTVVMESGYEPIPNNNCWQGAENGTISNNSLTYTFTPTKATTVVFKSYHPITITTPSEKVTVGSTTTITIDSGYDSSATYKIYISKDNGATFTEYSSATQKSNVLTTSTLAYGEYVFKVQEITDDYDNVYSNTLNVKAVLGKVVIEYYYQEYKTGNSVPYDPYIGMENNLNTTATTYTKTLESTDISEIEADGYVNTYKKYAPSISSYYFDYQVRTDNVQCVKSDNGKLYTITGDVMKPIEKIYTVTINGKQELTSYYQQKTYLLDASEYYTGEAPNGYMWYYLNSDNSIQIVSTSRYYKLRVAMDTVLHVAPIDKALDAPVTIINDPVYNEVNVNNVLKVQMNMLVENYLPDGAVRTRTGVAYCAYTGTQPTIDSADLSDLIHNSAVLAESGGSICTIGTLGDVTIKGYYTKQDNENGKFIFAPTAKLDSQNTYLVYSYLTYTMNNRSVTVVSEHPVTASVALYQAENNS
ncbi:MAG: starch-binding protein [Ruminococcus sp.]